jgi:hypothetical protein
LAEVMICVWNMVWIGLGGICWIQLDIDTAENEQKVLSSWQSLTANLMFG